MLERLGRCVKGVVVTFLILDFSKETVQSSLRKVESYALGGSDAEASDNHGVDIHERKWGRGLLI